MTTFKAAAVQMRTGISVGANVDAAETLIREAAAAGAEYVLTPEMTTILDRDRARLLAAIAPEASDPSLVRFRALARELGIHLHIGSMAIKLGEDGVANRGFLIGPDGGIVARYDKIHMFDVDLAGGESYRESRLYRPGSAAVVADLPWTRLGLTVCYDVRFPQLYRALAHAGAEVIAVPAAFTRTTGEAHWHVLLRARAIETGSCVIAAAQGGQPRGRPRDLRPFDDRRSVGQDPRRSRTGARHHRRRDRPAGERHRAAAHPGARQRARVHAAGRFR